MLNKLFVFFFAFLFSWSANAELFKAEEFFLNNGIATLISDTFPVDECLFNILNNDWRLPLMEAAVKNVAKPHAAGELGDFIIETVNTGVCRQDNQ